MPPSAVRPGEIRVELPTTLPSPLCDTDLEALIRSYLPAQYQETLINYKPEVPQGENPYFVWWVKKNGELWCNGGNIPPIQIKSGSIRYPPPPISDYFNYLSNHNFNDHDFNDDNHQDQDVDHADGGVPEGVSFGFQNIKFVSHYNEDVPGSFFISFTSN